VIVISYPSRELAHRCTKLDVAQQWLGPTDAQALIDLIADAEALENAQELMDFYRAETREGDTLLVLFSPRCGAVFMPIGSKLPRNADGALAWERVRRLMLVNVEEG
jgi:hypothetical protein